jgi:plasmid stabilization system protein ParE
MRIELDSSVYSDLLEIMEYYDGEAGAEVAAEFYAEFRRCLKAAAERPFSFPTIGELRRVNLDKFPYHFLFKLVSETTVRILIVKHSRRHPDFGLDR